MEDYYLEIRNVHIWAVASSGSLFFLRGLALNAFGAQWARAAALRYLGITIDTVLLTAALMLATVVKQYPFVEAWLTAKVLLLIVYFTLAAFAFKEKATRRARIGAFIAASAVFLFIVSVARARDPLGVFALFAG